MIDLINVFLDWVDTLDLLGFISLLIILAIAMMAVLTWIAHAWTTFSDDYGDDVPPPSACTGVERCHDNIVYLPAQRDWAMGEHDGSPQASSRDA